MSEMVPCPQCDRYVKAEDAECPFCNAPRVAGEPAVRRPSPGLSRAAAFAVRAALATGALAAAVACGDEDEGKGQQAAGGQASGGKASGGTASGGMASGGIDPGPDDNLGGGGFAPVPVYGGPFPDMIRAKV